MEEGVRVSSWMMEGSICRAEQRTLETVRAENSDALKLGKGFTWLSRKELSLAGSKLQSARVLPGKVCRQFTGAMEF